MKKIVTGLSMLSMLALAAGCSDDNTWANEANTGKATIPLVSNGFTLSGTINIHEDLAGVLGDIVATKTAESDDAAVVFTLAPGDYIPDLVGWSLSDGDGVVAEEGGVNDDAFQGFTPADFSIVGRDNVDLQINFQLPAQPPIVISTQGTGTITLQALEDANLCGGCDDGQTCAVIDGDDPTCVTLCPNGNECDGEDECVTAVDEDEEPANFCAAPLP